MAKLTRVRDLDVYRLSFSAAMAIFKLSKRFPPDERFSLTDQIRGSSRSVCSNLSEGWPKRGYKAVFVNKLTDSMQEAGETQTWLEFANACGYLENEEFEGLDNEYERILGKLHSMELKADSFCF